MMNSNGHKRKRVFTLRRMVWAALAGALALTTAIFCVPTLLIKIVFPKAAKAAGFDHFSGDLRSVGLFSTDLADVRLDAGGVSCVEIDYLRINYKPLALLRGQIDDCQISGLRLEVQAGGGGASLRGWTPPASSGTQSKELKTVNRFGMIMLRDSVVILHGRGGVARVNFSGVVAAFGNEFVDAYRASIRIKPLQGRLNLVASYLPDSGEMSCEVSADSLRLEDADGILKALAPAPFRMRGNLELDATAQLTGTQIDALNVKGKIAGFQAETAGVVIAPADATPLTFTMTKKLVRKEISGEVSGLSASKEAFAAIDLTKIQITTRRLTDGFQLSVSAAERLRPMPGLMTLRQRETGDFELNLDIGADTVRFNAAICRTGHWSLRQDASRIAAEGSTFKLQGTNSKAGLNVGFDAFLSSAAVSSGTLQGSSNTIQLICESKQTPKGFATDFSLLTGKISGSTDKGGWAAEPVSAQGGILLRAQDNRPDANLKVRCDGIGMDTLPIDAKTGLLEMKLLYKPAEDVRRSTFDMEFNGSQADIQAGGLTASIDTIALKLKGVKGRTLDFKAEWDIKAKSVRQGQADAPAASAGPVSLSGKATASNGEKGLTFEGAAQLLAKSMSFPGGGAAEIAASIPFSYPSLPEGDDALQGKVSISKLHAAGLDLGGFNFSMLQNQEGYQLKSRRNSLLFQDASISIDGHAKLPWSAKPYWDVDAHYSKIDTAAEWPLDSLSAKLAGYTFSGGLDLSVKAAMKDNLSASLNAEIKNASLRNLESAFSVDGLDVKLSGLDIIQKRCGPDQTLNASEIKLGTIAFQDFKGKFQVVSDKEIIIDNSRMKWCGGRVRLSATRIGPSDSFSTLLVCDEISLAQTLKQLYNMEITENGSGGRLNGQIPMDYTDGVLIIRKGFLHSPPDDGGNIMMLNCPGPVGAAISCTPLIAEALKDFHFNWTKFTIDGPPGDDALKVNWKMYGLPNRKLPLGLLFTIIKVDDTVRNLVESGQGEIDLKPFLIDVDLTTYSAIELVKFATGFKSIMQKKLQGPTH